MKLCCYSDRTSLRASDSVCLQRDHTGICTFKYLFEWKFEISFELLTEYINFFYRVWDICTARARCTVTSRYICSILLINLIQLRLILMCHTHTHTLYLMSVQAD